MNCSEFPNSCLLYQLSILEYMLNMLTYIRFARLVQLAHLSLRKPQGLLLQLNVNLCRTIISGVYDYFILGHPVCHIRTYANVMINPRTITLCWRKRQKSLRKLKAPESYKQSKISIPLQAIYHKLNEAYTITRIIYGQFTVIRV